MKSTSLYIIIVLLVNMVLHSEANAAVSKEKTIGINGIAGFPQMLGLEFRYLGLNPIHFGVSFGSLPINSILNSQITLEPIPLDLSLGDTYYMYPFTSYQALSTSVFTRYCFGEGGFFFQLMYTSWSFSASVSGSLQNETLGTSFGGAISGSASLNQAMVTPSFGYQFYIFDDLFMEFALGASILTKPTRSISLGGTAIAALMLLPGGEEEFEKAKTQIETQYNDAIDTLDRTLKILPAISIGLGWSF